MNKEALYSISTKAYENIGVWVMEGQIIKTGNVYSLDITEPNSEYTGAGEHLATINIPEPSWEAAMEAYGGPDVVEREYKDSFISDVIAPDIEMSVEQGIKY